MGPTFLKSFLGGFEEFLHHRHTPPIHHSPSPIQDLADFFVHHSPSITHLGRVTRVPPGPPLLLASPLISSFYLFPPKALGVHKAVSDGGTLPTSSHVGLGMNLRGSS